MEFSKIITLFDGVIGDVHFDNENSYYAADLAIGAIVERFNVLPEKRFILGLKDCIERLISKSDWIHYGQLENDMIESVQTAESLSNIKFNHDGNAWCFEWFNREIKENKFTFESFNQAEVER